MIRNAAVLFALMVLMTALGMAKPAKRLFPAPAKRPALTQRAPRPGITMRKAPYHGKKTTPGIRPHTRPTPKGKARPDIQYHAKRKAAK